VAAVKIHRDIAPCRAVQVIAHLVSFESAAFLWGRWVQRLSGHDTSANGRFEVVPFAARDGFPLDLWHLRGSSGRGRQPVLLVHGAGVRANLFNPPTERTLPEMLEEAGYDVWLLNWRASIDHAPNPWTLDQAAVNDHPAAVDTVLERSGADTLKTVIHCQGSTSFMMSIVAGLMPRVSTVVANAVALHTIVPPLARMKARYATNTVGALVDYLNPQWGLQVSGLVPRLIDFFVRAMHHECENAVCKHSSFTYGSGSPTLWRHENLDSDVHEWIKGEFAHVPMTFFRQMARCIAKGNLVSTGKYAELPADFIAQAPRTEARFVFLAGERNVCFLPESMWRTFDYFDGHAPGRHACHELAGYGHLDVFIGKNAARDTLPLILDELGRN
jgi:hypothetical protein